MDKVKIFFNAILIFILVLIFVFATNFIVEVDGRNSWNYYCYESMPKKQAALVLGARVYEDGSMSTIFQDRVITALNLYKQDKVDKILISGDHGTEDYDEVNAAKDYLLENDVAPEDIFLDHAGFDTYDSVYRARDVFQADSLIIVTQDFHLPRAIYIANELEIPFFCGVNSDLHKYSSDSYSNFREKFARTKAWMDVFLRSEPKYLGDPIPLSGDGQESWD